MTGKSVTGYRYLPRSARSSAELRGGGPLELILFRGQIKWHVIYNQLREGDLFVLAVPGNLKISVPPVAIRPWRGIIRFELAKTFSIRVINR